MPIYEYKCNDCGKEFEVLTTSSRETEKVVCDICRSTKVQKIMSTGSFRLSAGRTLPSAPPSGCGGKSGFS